MSAPMLPSQRSGSQGTRTTLFAGKRQVFWRGPVGSDAIELPEARWGLSRNSGRQQRVPVHGCQGSKRRTTAPTGNPCSRRAQK